MSKIKYSATIILFIIVQSVSAQQHKINSESLMKLLDGNLRFTSGSSIHGNQSLVRVKEVVKGQHPYAIIVGCSDSRVPPEVIFDQGVGDLFVIRTAGNLVDDIALGSIEYAVEHLHVPLIMVLGHEKCGAVDAALQGGEAPGQIQKLIDKIKPAVDATASLPGDKLDNAVIDNIKRIVDQLKHSKPIIEEFLHHKKINIVGARYDLDEGKVTLVD
jgi:carbonic anhydrase